jgi:predicted TIM-barrel fold metal-dependent hydrolase
MNIPRATTTRIDAYTHFVRLKFLDFAENQGGQHSPAANRSLFMRKPTLINVGERLHLPDRNEVDIHVLVPLPWLDSFPGVASDQKLAPQAARIMNDEVAAVVASNPKRFRGEAVVNVEATVGGRAFLYRR